MLGGSPRRACGGATGLLPAEAVERLEFELGVIGEMGFDSYFLIVWDFVKFAKENGIAVGPGRGWRRGRSSPTRSTSPTSIRSTTTSCSSGSEPGAQVHARHRHRLLPSAGAIG